MDQVIVDGTWHLNFSWGPFWPLWWFLPSTHVYYSHIQSFQKLASKDEEWHNLIFFLCDFLFRIYKFQESRWLGVSSSFSSHLIKNLHKDRRVCVAYGGTDGLPSRTHLLQTVQIKVTTLRKYFNFTFIKELKSQSLLASCFTYTHSPL